MMAGKHRVSSALREQLGERSEILGIALDTRLECVAIIGDEGDVLDVNARLTSALGFEPEQLLGKTASELSWPPSLQTHIQHLLEQEPTEQQCTLRTVLLRSDGSEVEFLAEITRCDQVSPGAPILLARLREVGEDKAARELRESEERYRALAEYSPYGILVHTSGNIQYANRAVTKIWGGSREELLSKSLLAMVHPESREEVMARIIAMIGDTSNVPTLREKLLRRDGTTFYADVQGTTIPFNGKRAVQLVIRDVTEEQDREARLAQAERLEAIGNLTSSVAHDFNNLLTVVISSCALAARRCPENTKLQSDLSTAQFAAKRGGALTKQLLAFGRKHEATERLVQLSSVIEEISLLITKLLGAAIPWTLNAQPNLWASNVNSLQVEQVVMNLASNAKIAMPDGGRLDIEARNVELDDSPASARARAAGLNAGRFVTLRISDTGVGMDDATRERIFEKSFTTGAEKGGSGLGLATVYSIIRDSGGAILVDSTPGQGSVFTLYFPASMAPREPSRSAPAPEEPVRGDETILFIEDQERVRTATRAILELHGYRVVEAEGCAAARELLGDMLETIDLILSDVMLGDGTGPEVVEEALAKRPGLPVVYISGFASTQALASRKRSSEAPVVAKPFLPAEICGQVRRLLDADKAGGNRAP